MEEIIMTFAVLGAFVVFFLAGVGLYAVFEH
jgi:hypothetical protein